MIIEGYIVVGGVVGAIAIYRKMKGNDNNAQNNKMAERFFTFFLIGNIGMGAWVLMQQVQENLLHWWNF